MHRSKPGLLNTHHYVQHREPMFSKNKLPQRELSAGSDSVSFVVRHHLREGAQAAYELWLTDNMRVAAAFPGYLGIKVVRPHASGLDYTLVLDFATHEDATRWHQSTERADLIQNVQPHLDVAPHVIVGAGIDYWFQAEPAAPGLPPQKPPAWKQWLITTSVIWPLSMVVPFAFDPLFHALPALGTYGVAHGIQAAAVIALVVWLIMPPYTRLLHGWLFARTDQSATPPDSAHAKGKTDN